MINIKKIADAADIIVNGYAFTKCNLGIRVLNLSAPTHAVLLSNNGEVLETSMSDIELQLVKKYYQENKQFMED